MHILKFSYRKKQYLAQLLFCILALIVPYIITILSIYFQNTKFEK